MEDQPVFNEKDLWALNEVKARLIEAQHKLEECNDHYLARTIYLDDLYLDLQKKIETIENTLNYAAKGKIINHFEDRWLNTTDMWELKGD